MADYSYVNVYIKPTVNVEVAETMVRTLCAEFVEWERPNIDANIDANLLEITVPEARYGDSIYTEDHGHATPITLAVQCGWAWTSYDGGSYEWGPWRLGWKPGMTHAVYQNTTGEGALVLTESEWRELLDSEPDDPIAAVSAHFGEDPEKWLGHRTSVEWMSKYYKEGAYAHSE